MSTHSSKVLAIKECLGIIINEEVTADIVDHVLTITNPEDYHEFMYNIINTKNPEHMRYYNLLKDELFKTPMKTKKSKSNPIVEVAEAGNSNQNNNKGKKTKYTPFYGQNNVELRKGRHPCNCQASKHDLINNCTECGRIVCQQEGSGPCLFCGNMVVTKHEMEILQSKTKESDKLYNQLMEQKTSKEWKKAIENRNKLLAVDQLGVVKNKVFDDQNDYFDLNSKWDSDKEKVEQRNRYLLHRNQLHKSKRDFKFALDFASRTVTFDDEQSAQKQKLLKGVDKLLEYNETRCPKNLFDGDKNKLMEQIVQLMQQSSLTHKSSDVYKGTSSDAVSKKLFAANNELLESIDQGMCISMHQPWASLLVAGIKIHEGRTWKTEHRGRLWIAAASKEPESEDILACEEMYRVLYNDDTIKFPKKYPTSCLLGCVFVEDCLDQETYKKKFGESGESSSPYVMICSNPVILPVFYPMQGQHKIFPLPKEIHRTAKAALMSSKWI